MITSYVEMKAIRANLRTIPREYRSPDLEGHEAQKEEKFGAEITPRILLERTVIDNDRRYSKEHRELTGQPRISFPSRAGGLWMQLSEDFSAITHQTPFDALAEKEDKLAEDLKKDY
jgi:hypothetical protein